MTGGLFVVLLVAIVAAAFWPCRKGVWDEYGDGYLYVYAAVDGGRTLGEVYAEREGWMARVTGRGAVRFSTVEAAMRHVETESEP